MPQDEASRLATLHGLNILDTPPEERFDRLTRLAKHLLGVPIAVVSLVDTDRQWFKSCQGLGASETPRSISFCGHAILDDQLFVIPDALLDPRFADNPLVTGAPNIRFYAGQPLKAGDGNRLGTLCVIDSKPHQLTQTERNSLRDLAVLVENELNSVEYQDATRALLNSQNRLTAVLEHILDGIITISEKGIVESFNQSAIKIFGYAANEVIGNNVKMLMPDPYHREHDGYLQHFVTTGEKKVIGIGREVTGKRKDGSTFPMDLAVSEMKLGDHRMFTGIVRDITERNRAIQLQRENEARLAGILDNVLDGIITIGERGIVESFNKSAEQIFGYAASEVIGSNVKMLMPDPYHREHDGYLHNFMTTGKKKIIGIGRQVVGRRKDGTTFPMDLAVSEMQLGDKRMFTGIVRDITERVKIERMKTEFISTVSHELRTPLTSIRGSLGLIAGGVAGVLPAQAKALLDIAHKNSERLILLVNDILDMEKIEAGKMEFQPKPTELMALLKQALEGNRAYAEQFNVTYELAGKLTEVMVNLDANRLQQVLANLLSNAAKFSPAGGRVIVAASSDGKRVRVSVSDRGSGIPEQFRSQIFQKFAQADSSDTRKKGGTGLGLSITKAIVEQMDGSIGFDSQPDVSTTFWVEFPVWQEIASITPDVTGAVNRKRVLICEDDRDIASLLKLMLEQAEMAADIAYDAAQARNMLSLYDYAAMTLDLGLPDQSGISLIRELRLAKETANLPIIVVSANASQGKGEFKGEAFCVIDWINKPIDRHQLEAALQQAIAQSEGTRPKVLHVEDDLDIYQVVHAIVGEIADMENATTLAAARQMLKDGQYDLVILDVTLPDGSGMELLHELNSTTPPIPVMVFSAMEITREAIQQVGASLVKSRTDNAQLLATIKRMVGVK